MSASETPYTNLAMVIAANGHRGSLSETVFKPVANVLAMIGIEPHRPRLLALLQDQSVAMTTGVAINTQVGSIIEGKEIEKPTTVSNDSQYKVAA